LRVSAFFDSAANFDTVVGRQPRAKFFNRGIQGRDCSSGVMPGAASA